MTLDQDLRGAGAFPWSDLERTLVDHLVRGERLDLAAGEWVGHEAMLSWDDSRAIRATVLRDIVREPIAGRLDPRGLRLRGARIIGRLDLENMTTGVAIDLTDCLIDEGLDATDANLFYLGLNGCLLNHPSAAPLDGERMTSAKGVSLAGARICARCEDGAVRLSVARIGGQLNCTNTEIDNPCGPALVGAGMQVDQNLVLENLAATGSGQRGAVHLIGAHITGELNYSGGVRTQILNASGPAIVADRLRVEQNMVLGGQFIGAGDDGAIRLIGARIDGQLNCVGAKIRNGSGPALRTNGLQVGHDLLLTGLDAVGKGTTPTINLTNTRVAGNLTFAPTRYANDPARPHLRITLDGLTYSGIPCAPDPPTPGLRRVLGRRTDRTDREHAATSPLTLDEWLELLRDATPVHAEQPYQQLAAAYLAHGQDREARKILIKQRRERIRRTPRLRPWWVRIGRLRTWGAWILDLTIGYGYRPWRAILFLLGTGAVAVALALGLGGSGGLARPATTGHPLPCDRVERALVGVDLALPLIHTGVRAHCDFTTSPAGHNLAIAGAGVQAAAWVFATLFVAGFTNVVRKL